MDLSLVNSFDYQGFSIRPSLRRVYSLEQAAFHVIGYLKPFSSSEIALLRDNGIIPGFVTLSDLDYSYLLRSWKQSRLVTDLCGATGMERVCENRIRGDSGKRTTFRVRARSQLAEELLPPRNGSDVHLSIDKRIQIIAYEELTARTERGAAIVMDPVTGEVLAMVSVPSVRPGSLAIPAEAAEIFRSENFPLVNRAISGMYPLGSVMKPVIAAMGLEESLIDEETEIECSGVLEKGGHLFHCFQNASHGAENLVDALKHSCNIFFYKLSELSSPEMLTTWGDKFGLGRGTGIELPGEKSGRLPRGRNWLTGKKYMFVIGQGEVEVTPIQAIRIISAFANGGKLVTPTLFKVRNYPSYRDLGLSEETIRVIREGLWKVVNENEGTGSAARIPIQGVEVAGKTGSAEVQGKNSHSWFAGFAPFDKPRYAVVVLCENMGTGGKHAAPVAGRILERILKLE
ncbi:MAG: hypothetical protein Kow00107_11030 [Planctomycetota bacterium]